MIARLQGMLVDKCADRVVLDIQGVGYEVLIPFSTYYELGEVGEVVSLHIYTHVKEEALSLYGFLTTKEKALFTQLIQVSGIGPKLGITILSGLPIGELIKAVSSEDIIRLKAIPGVGKKTAERLLLEIKDKVMALFPEAQEIGEAKTSGKLQRDVVSALVNLGYSKNTAEKAVTQVPKPGETDRFEDLLRKSLRELVV